MTKRSLETDLADASDEVLTDLEPDERLQATLEAHAQGSARWIERLHETAAVYEYRSINRAYTQRLRLAHSFGQTAVFELATATHIFNRLHEKQMTQLLADLSSDDAPITEHLDPAQDRADTLAETATHLKIIYDSYVQFADDPLGVDIDTWLAFHDHSDHVLDTTCDILTLDLHDPTHLNTDADEDSDSDLELADAIDARHDALTNKWYNIVDQLNS